MSTTKKSSRYVHCRNCDTLHSIVLHNMCYLQLYGHLVLRKAFGRKSKTTDNTYHGLGSIENNRTVTST